MFLYRLLRPDETWMNGLSAKDPSSSISVFEHVTKGSRGSKSKYISTCGSLNAVLNFKINSSNSTIVKIRENDLQTEKKIDLRTQENRNNYYTHKNAQEDIDRFNNFANKFEEVLLVGNVPGMHVELVTKSDFPPGKCPVWLQ